MSCLHWLKLVFVWSICATAATPDVVAVKAPSTGIFEFSELRLSSTGALIFGLITNRTGQTWPAIEFAIEASGTCAGEAYTWHLRLTGSLDEKPQRFSETPKRASPAGARCEATAFAVRYIGGLSTELMRQYDAIAPGQLTAEQRQSLNAAQLKHAEIEAELQRRTEEERFRTSEKDYAEKLAELSRQQERTRAANEKLRAAEAAAMKQVQENCAKIWAQTIDRKISDLTVRESEQVQLCRSLGAYRKAEANK